MLNNRLSRLVLLSALSALFGVSAFAQTAASAAAPTINSGDTAWMLVSSALVLLMTPGLAFFYGGFVRSKNAASTIMQSFIALAVISMIWFVFGYSLAFSPTNGGWIGGLSWAFLSSVGTAPNADYGATIPHSLFMIYQCMFAIITPALITGAFAERVKFKTYLVFMVLWSAIVYVPVAHWVWGVGGFLRTSGVLDFAGGTVVHQTAGFSALAAAWVFGRRKDYGKPVLAAHNIPFIVLGTGMLWFGWFGFNGGSAIGSNELATSAFTTTHFAAASAAFTWMIMDWIFKGKPSVAGACVGAVVGLVAITPASGFVSMGSGVIIGIAGAAVANIVAMIRSKTQIDDSLDVFACHGVGGLVGALLTGLLASKTINPAGVDGSIGQFFIQLKASVIVAVYSMVATFIILKVIDKVMELRSSEKDEEAGLDQAEHGERAYIHH